MRMYVGGYTGGTGGEAGIRAYEADPETGALTFLSAADDAPDASFLAFHPSGRVLYAVHELGEFAGAPQGALSAYAVDPATGSLSLLARRGTGGAHPCHVSVHPSGRAAYVANYGGGSVAAFALDAAGVPSEAPRVHRHAGAGPDRDRQAGPHAHCALPDPTGAWLLAADLGIDSLLAYRLDASALPAPDPVATALPPGRGPRHLAFGPDGVLWLASELEPVLSAFAFGPETGVSRLLRETPLAPAVAAERCYPSEVRPHPSGRLLLVGERGPDALSAFRPGAGGAADPVARVPSGGRFPRHFGLAPDGRLLIAALQKSDALAAFRVDAEAGALSRLPGSVSVPNPACVVFAPPGAWARKGPAEPQGEKA